MSSKLYLIWSIHKTMTKTMCMVQHYRDLNSAERRVTKRSPNLMCPFKSRLTIELWEEVHQKLMYKLLKRLKRRRLKQPIQRIRFGLKQKFKSRQRRCLTIACSPTSRLSPSSTWAQKIYSQVSPTEMLHPITVMLFSSKFGYPTPSSRMSILISKDSNQWLFKVRTST